MWLGVIRHFIHPSESLKARATRWWFIFPSLCDSTTHSLSYSAYYVIPINNTNNTNYIQNSYHHHGSWKTLLPSNIISEWWTMYKPLPVMLLELTEESIRFRFDWTSRAWMREFLLTKQLIFPFTILIYYNCWCCFAICAFP